MNQITFSTTITGWLAHDNKLFNLTCPQDGGMYSLLHNCPKCGAELVPIAVNEQNMAISEGTVYPSFGKKTMDKYEKTLQSRKNSMPITYRFKVFAFCPKESLVIPSIHPNCKKGTLINLTINNHPPIASWYATKDRVTCVELMYMIFEQYGDSVQIPTPPQAAKTTTEFQPNKPIEVPYPQKTTKPIPTVDINTLSARLEQLEKLLCQNQNGITNE